MKIKGKQHEIPLLSVWRERVHGEFTTKLKITIYLQFCQEIVLNILLLIII